MKNSLEHKLIEPSLVGKWLLEKDIWQMQLVSPRDLGRLAGEKGLSFWSLGDDIERLWQIGLLRADLIWSKKPLKINGLVFLKIDEYDVYYYSDTRNFKQKNRLGGIIPRLTKLPKGVNLLFHPFRYYVLYKIEDYLKLGIAPMTLLQSVEGYFKLFADMILYFQKKSSIESLTKQFNYWNNITSLAVAVEPCAYDKVFGYMNISRIGKNENYRKEFDLQMKNHLENCRIELKNIGLDKLKAVLEKLCISATSLDSNHDIHIALRLTKKNYRLEKVKGKLGGAIYLLTMAELLRRCAEIVFETELPEEDELYTGRQGKEYFYGTKRLLDKDKKTGNEFLRGLGLDYGTRVRWYVEGDTEFAALHHVLGNHNKIELINLRGLIVAKGGKGIAFRENLTNDIRSSVFSFVSLDGDVIDNLRVLEKAIENDEMFGMRFISKPDFEFANFTVEELSEIVWEIGLKEGINERNKEKFLNEAIKASSGKDFFNIIQKLMPSLRQINKGKIWGQRLMDFAIRNRSIKLSNGSVVIRPVIEAIRHALTFTDSTSYHLTKRKFKVDIKTGKLERIEN